MSVGLISAPNVVHSIIQSFLPAAGILSRNISKAMDEAVKKQTSSWNTAAKQYGFKIIDPLKAKEEFIAQYEVLKKTNKVLLDKFPFLAKECKDKDPLQLSRKIAECLQKSTEKKATQAKSLEEEILKTNGDIRHLAKALISLLKIEKKLDFSAFRWLKLSDKHIEFLECYLDIHDDHQNDMLLSSCIQNFKIDFVKAIIQKLKPLDKHIHVAVVTIRHTKKASDKAIAKGILKVLFHNASEEEKKKYNEIIKAHKAQPKNEEQFRMSSFLGSLFLKAKPL